jgi:DNA-binding response OmpR family regulator
MAASSSTGSGRVVVIEDDFHSRTATAALLRTCGLAVMEFGGEIAARGLDQAADFDAIIADMNLGHGANGLAIALELCTQAGRRVPILLVSGSLGRRSRLLAEQTGIRLMFKPIDPDVLLDWLRDEAGLPC